ncbi:ScbA/BarX family gamma-butyrolactone biosynthesis protein [Streptomyces sp. NBC_00203]|uniref:ScbA/BarX family gamma-butyrolactone biosynthesis protein n=1 Tax=Streptomyces sp. NBC_00203 TaxID=2975680 RepID=UPI00324D41E1
MTVLVSTPIKADNSMAATAAMSSVGATGRTTLTRPSHAAEAADGARIPREFVHRADDTDVLLTHFQACADGSYRMAARWPRAHALFSPVAGSRENPMLMAETIRQAGAVVSHMAYDAPTDLHFLLWDLRYEVPEDILGAGVPLSPATAVVRFDDVKMRGKRLSSFRFEVELYRGAVRVGHGAASASCVSQAAYSRLRPARPESADPAPLPAPISPVLVGRTRAQDVLVAPSGTPGSWLLRADRSHPVIFDSQSDHLPGRGAIEAMRQAAQLAAGYEHIIVPSMNAEFCRYVELDRPCHITAERRRPLPDGRIPTRVTLTQDDEVAARGMLMVRPAEADSAADSGANGTSAPAAFATV